MQDRGRLDLRSQWLDLVTQWERGFDAIANQLMGGEGFSRWMNYNQQLALTVQKVAADTLGRQLNALNVPTRDDVKSVSDALNRIERQLQSVEERLAKVEQTAAGPSSTRKGPPRTKQPPAEMRSQEHAPRAEGQPTQEAA